MRGELLFPEDASPRRQPAVPVGTGGRGRPFGEECLCTFREMNHDPSVVQSIRSLITVPDTLTQCLKRWKRLWCLRFTKRNVCSSLGVYLLWLSMWQYEGKSLNNGNFILKCAEKYTQWKILFRDIKWLLSNMPRRHRDDRAVWACAIAHTIWPLHCQLAPWKSNEALLVWIRKTN